MRKSYKLKNLGKDVGGAIKDFKKSVQDDESTHQANQPKTLDSQDQQNTDTSNKH